MEPVVKVYGPAMSWNIARGLVSLEESGVKYELVGRPSTRAAPISQGTYVGLCHSCNCL